MEKIIKITSHQNPNIKQVIKLKKRRERDFSNLFLIEGYRELKKACEGNEEIVTLLYSPKHFLKDNEFALIKQIAEKSAKILECEDFIFEKLSYRDRPDGLIAIAKQKPRGTDYLQKILDRNKSPFFLIAEQIEKPGNLGTILRSADASGVDGVIVCNPCTDIYNPNVVRASIGTLFTVPTILGSNEEILALLKKHNITILAATPSAEKKFTDAQMDKSIAIAVGSEQYGLSDFWMENSDVLVSIPMKGSADSLNVATATTLLLYEAIRQRKN